MTNKLEMIILQKQREVENLKQHLLQLHNHPIAQVMRGKWLPESVPKFKQALQNQDLAVIAEIKRQSPSKGKIDTIANPVQLAQRYIAGGANALSILTDKTFFAGDLSDLTSVVDNIKHQTIPVLRKDFIIDKLQIAEAKVAGASAILIIMKVLGKQAKSLIEFAHSLYLDVLVEVHDVDELNQALDFDATLIGVNNRDLNNFKVDTDHAMRMISHIPKDITKVAESGITQPALARAYYESGFEAVLIGEALVRSTSPEKFIQECRCDNTFSHH